MSLSRELTEPQEGLWEPLIYSWSVRNPGDALGLGLACEGVWGSPVGWTLSPRTHRYLRHTHQSEVDYGAPTGPGELLRGGKKVCIELRAKSGPSQDGVEWKHKSLLGHFSDPPGMSLHREALLLIILLLLFFWIKWIPRTWDIVTFINKCVSNSKTNASDFFFFFSNQLWFLGGHWMSSHLFAWIVRNWLFSLKYKKANWL